MLKIIITGLLLGLPVTIGALHKPAAEIKRMRASSAEAKAPVATRVEAKLTAEQTYQSKQLFLAIAEENKEAGLAALKKLIADNANLNQPNENRDTPLCFAIDLENTDAATELINAGADVNQAAGGSITPLMLAVDRGLTNIVTLLLAKGANVNAQDDYKNSVLMRAILKEDITLVQLLLATNPKLGLTNSKNQTALIIAQVMQQAKSKEGAETAADSNQIVELLQQQQKLYDERGAQLTLVIENDNIKKLQELLELNANPNIKGEGRAKFPTFPLHAAAGYGNEEAVKLLLAAGADIDLQEERGYNALAWAVSRGLFDIVKILLEAGANVDASMLPLRKTIEYHGLKPKKHTKIFDLLLSYKPNISKLDTDYDETFLMAAVRSTNYETVQKLLEAGADTSLKNSMGQTAYDYAIHEIEKARHYLTNINQHDQIEIQKIEQLNKITALIKSYEDKREEQKLAEAPAETTASGCCIIS